MRINNHKFLGIIISGVTLFLVIIFMILMFFTKGEVRPPYIRSFTENKTEVTSTKVIIDDKVNDYYYYKGLNYTTSDNLNTPSGEDKQIYKDENLVNVNIIYQSKDLNNNLEGAVSKNEAQKEYEYYKVYPVNNNNTINNKNDDYVTIELIDNPFTKKPLNKAFNGWVTSYNQVIVYLDSDYYIRYAKIPVQYENNLPKKIDITFNASWINATVSEMTGNWNTAFDSLKPRSFQKLDFFERIRRPLDMTGYYKEVSISYYNSCNGYYDTFGNYQQSNCRCYSNYGCKYYSKVQSENYVDNQIYFELVNGRMSRVNPNNLPFEYEERFINGFTETSNMASFFEKRTLSFGNSQEGYYDSDGQQLSGICRRNSCLVYKLLNYYENNTLNTIDKTKEYYYLVTRDTNIIVLRTITSNNWGNHNKPFTLTSYYNNNDYISSSYLQVNRYAFSAQADMTIENIKIRSNYRRENGTAHPSADTNNPGVFYANYKNVKFGRGIIPYNNRFLNFVSVIGGNNLATGSSYEPVKSNLIIESGIYQMLSLTNGYVRDNRRSYVDIKATYGSDFDRAAKINNELEVYFCASGSWGGHIYGSSEDKPMFNLVVKSGHFGSGQHDYSTGIYVGGRGSGVHYNSKSIKVEGGNIYNLIGGPLTTSSRKDKNDVFIYVTGGNIDSIVAGAGITATYGNRIVQLTGGSVNYHVFGGSNGYKGSSNDGLLNGDSFIYVGGNAEIGRSDLVQSNSKLYGAEAGSVFGIGNGRNGHSSIGSSNNSNVIIKDNAIIHNNVYGGGNYGATGVAEGLSTTKTKITVDGGIIKGSLYGGGNNNGSGSSGVKSSINIKMIKGEIRGSLYGGSNEEGVVYGDVNLDILGGTFAESIYGGGKGGFENYNSKGTYVRNNITINIGSNNTIPQIDGNVYGGSAYGSVNTISEHIIDASGNIKLNINNINIKGSIFGGGKGASGYNPKVNGEIRVVINKGNIKSVYGGNDLTGITRKINTIYILGGFIGDVYGGGNQVSAKNSYIKLIDGNVNNIFGGSNQAGDVESSEIILSGGSVGNVYGANNVGGTTKVTNIYGHGSDVLNIYGGGKLAPAHNTNISVSVGNVVNVFGGGEQASVYENSSILFNRATATNIYGGSDQSGHVKNTMININSGNVTNIYGGGKYASIGDSFISVYGGNISFIFGGGEKAPVNNSTNINVFDGEVARVFGGSNVDGLVDKTFINLKGGYVGGVFGGNNLGGQVNNASIIIDKCLTGAVYGGGNEAYTNNANIEVKNKSQVENLYGGGNEAGVSKVKVVVNDSKVTYMYGGSNQSGNIDTSSIELNKAVINIFYGGNNQGGKTHNIEINSVGGFFNSIYGGGNAAASGLVKLNLNDVDVGYDVYGGGKDGALSGSAITNINNSRIKGSVYSGGHGVTAVVNENTTLNILGKTKINGHVFGGGNAAATGKAELDNSSSIVNIAGGEIDKNVYGGANTSVVYGNTELNIGDIKTLDNDQITIGGTIFGGGEANASGSEIYDFSFISVTKGININIINNPLNNINIKGSIFGSGNASSTAGQSFINIKNYGKKVDPINNISIQRATEVVLDNSHIALSGATDRTNEYSNVLFSLSRLDKLKLVNNSSLYLDNGANLVKRFESLKNNNEKAQVTIQNGQVTKNVDNRLYVKEGVNINIATNEAVTAYGEVSGMTFFGMYIRTGDGKVRLAYYDPSYNNGDQVKPGEFYSFGGGSYVLGSHISNHNTEVDGFYSNYESEEQEGVIEVKYIKPIPEDSNYYMWVIGEAISSYEVNLIASRFSTFGTYELPLINSPDPNTEFRIIGVNYNGLATNFQLVDESEVPRINIENTADTKMALVMKSSKTGWLTDGLTKFITAEDKVLGTEIYKSENSSSVPSLLFNLYHSKNIVNEGQIGTVVLNLVVIRPIDDLNNEVKRVNININLSRKLFNGNEYEAAMTPGEEHKFFVTTSTNITDKSKLSAYYSLYVENTNNIYRRGYYRALVSSFVLPAKTKITMIDFKTYTPTYYYYVVSEADVEEKNVEFNFENEASYELSKFTRMGLVSDGNYYTNYYTNYNDDTMNTTYYDDQLRIASEEFIFIVDYGEANIPETKLNNSLLIELRDREGEAIKGVLGINHANMKYNLYHNKGASLDINASFSKDKIYIKDSTVLNVKTNYNEKRDNGNIINDTTYFGKKLGLKISVFDENDNLLNGASLLGLTYTLDDVVYYPRMDGTIRLNISERVANAASKIKIDTSNSNLPSGKYKFKIESFGSVDGIYYGPVSNDTKYVYLELLNNIYGLNSKILDNNVTIDKITGHTMNKNNVVVFNIDYSSGLKKPNLRLSLKRRKYDEINSREYEVVDISDYIKHGYKKIGKPEKYEYLLTNNIPANTSIYLYMKENLKTGTYKVTFSLYDAENYIGEVYNYIVIR